MFDKKEQQTIQGVNDSQINQAGGNVIVNNYGMSVTEVMGLVKELVSSEMSQYLHQALYYLLIQLKKLIALIQKYNHKSLKINK